jgi:CheY-like chemotaxis protein
MQRILVADDNDAMLRVITRALHRDGYDVEHARDGAELMHWVDALTDPIEPAPQIDLIVTDLRMPKCSGQECLEQLRIRGNRTPVILITAFGDDRVKRAAHASGVGAMFDKPVDLEQLRSAVRHILTA